MDESRGKRLAGNGDIAWVIAIALVVGLVTTLGVGHLQGRLHLLMIGAELNDALDDRQRLGEDLSNYEAEFQRVTAPQALREAAAEEGLVIPQPSQMREVEAP
ncbi:MAG: hypothetical protein ACI81R_002564 [Bradymonadia bacterium]|jgi:hypothetical protein